MVICGNMSIFSFYRMMLGRWSHPRSQLFLAAGAWERGSICYLIGGRLLARSSPAWTPCGIRSGSSKGRLRLAASLYLVILLAGRYISYHHPWVWQRREYGAQVLALGDSFAICVVPDPAPKNLVLISIKEWASPLLVLAYVGYSGAWFTSHALSESYHSPRPLSILKQQVCRRSWCGT